MVGGDYRGEGHSITNCLTISVHRVIFIAYYYIL
jgi:hypothetical protein